MTSSYAEVYGSWRKDPGRVLDGSGLGNRLVHKAQTAFDPDLGVLWPLVSRWSHQHLLQLSRPACVRWTRRSGRASSMTARSPAAKRTISYNEMLADVEAFAGALSDKGVAKGDRVVIYMPMVPEALVAMLACARLGAVHSVVFGGFAASELATRIEDSQAKLMVSPPPAASNRGGSWPISRLLDAAIEQSRHKPDMRRSFCSASSIAAK
jgi:propionyl-CoA synthetase